jgi:hypothetical protein
MSEIERRLKDEAGLSLEQLATYSRVPLKRVRAWADLEVDITPEEAVRLRTIISLYMGLNDRLVLAGEVLDETFGPGKQNGSSGK